MATVETFFVQGNYFTSMQISFTGKLVYRSKFKKVLNMYYLRDRVVKDWQSCQECKRFFPSIEAVKLHSSLVSYKVISFFNSSIIYQHMFLIIQDSFK